MPLSHQLTPDESEPDQPISCPGCAQRMDKVQEAGVMVDRCRSCGGIWLDALEMEKVLATKGAAKRIDSRPAAGPTPQAKRAGLWPRDKSTLIHMVDHKQPHVQFESCTVCGGAFLTAGELRDLSHNTLVERMRALLG